MPVLAQGTALFIGDKVAAVAAETKDLADAALDLIEVEYEELPVVADVRSARADDAPVLHPDLNSYEGLPAQVEGRHLNLFSHQVWDKGDVAAGFAEADVIIEADYSLSKGHQAYLESHNCVVSANRTAARRSGPATKRRSTCGRRCHRPMAYPPTP